LVFNLDLGGPDAVVANVLVELACSIFELGFWMQTVHSLAIVGNRGSELVENRVFQKEGVPVQVVRVVISFDEIEVEQRCVTVGFKLIIKFLEALIQT